jgi:hypothetical protein
MKYQHIQEVSTTFHALPNNYNLNHFKTNDLNLSLRHTVV